MADFSNRQLAEIISSVSEEIKKNVLKQTKLSNQIGKSVEELHSEVGDLEVKITTLKNTSIKADLSELNKFYEEKTIENIEKVNRRLNVPNFSIYAVVFSVVCLFISIFFIYTSMKSKQQIIDKYTQELKKEKVIISKEDNQLFEDMHQWFLKNPKIRQNFVTWRKQK